MRSSWRDGEHTREVELTALAPGRWRVRVDDAEFEVGAEALPDGRLKLTFESGVAMAEVTRAGTRRFVRLGTLDFVLEKESTGRRRAASGSHGGGLEAPMPGVVTRVLVAEGDQVSKGQPLVALEAMKMEHLIRAPHAGRVSRLVAAPGQMVQAGAVLVEMAAGAG